MRKLMGVILLCISWAGARAQYRIDTDRPDQTESALTVPKKYFQAEFGFGKENSGERNYTLIHPTFLLKYGAGRKIELRLEGNYSSQYLHFIPQTRKESSLAPLEVGTKIALWEEKGFIPKTSLIAHLGLPFTGSSYDPHQDLFPSFRFTFQNTLSDRVGLGYNLGAEWDGYTAKPYWLYTFSPNFSFGKNWYAYIEAFGFIRQGMKAEHALDGGLAYYTSDNTKVDLSGGFGIGSNPLKNYVAIGFSFRLPLGRSHALPASATGK